MAYILAQYGQTIDCLASFPPVPIPPRSIARAYRKPSCQRREMTALGQHLPDQIDQQALAAQIKAVLGKKGKQ